MSSFSSQKKKRKNQGITLVEVMVAVAILSMIVTLLWSAYSQTVRNKKRIESRLERSQEIRMALERMQKEISMAFVSAQENRNPSLRVMQTLFVGKDRGEKDRLDFTSFSHKRLYRNAHESDQNELSYFITHDPNDSDKQVLVRRESSRIDEHGDEGGKLEILLDDVIALEFEYLDTERVEWQKEWDTTQATGKPNQLPAQVKIFITVRSSNGKEITYGTRSVLPLRWGLNHAVYNAS